MTNYEVYFGTEENIAKPDARLLRIALEKEPDIIISKFINIIDFVN